MRSAFSLIFLILIFNISNLKSSDCSELIDRHFRKSPVIYHYHKLSKSFRRPIYHPHIQQVNLNHFIHYCGSFDHQPPPNNADTLLLKDYDYLHSSKILPTDYDTSKTFDHFQSQQSVTNHASTTKHSNVYDFVEVPEQVNNHDLEHDPSKSSYDTPGAVNSYGVPIRQINLQSELNFQAPEKTKVEDYFEAEISPEQLVHSQHHDSESHFDLSGSATEYNGNSRTLPNRESDKNRQQEATFRHPNHRYE